MTKLFIITLLLISTVAHSAKVKQTITYDDVNKQFIVELDMKKKSTYTISTSTDGHNWTVYTNMVPSRSQVVTFYVPHDEAIGLVKVREE